MPAISRGKPLGTSIVADAPFQPLRAREGDQPSAELELDADARLREDSSYVKRFSLVAGISSDALHEGGSGVDDDPVAVGGGERRDLRA